MLKSYKTPLLKEALDEMDFYAKSIKEEHKRILTKDEILDLCQKIRKSRSELWFHLLEMPLLAINICEYIKTKVHESKHKELCLLLEELSLLFKESKNKQDIDLWNKKIKIFAFEKMQKFDATNDFALEIISLLKTGHDFNCPQKYLSNKLRGKIISLSEIHLKELNKLKNKFANHNMLLVVHMAKKKFFVARKSNAYYTISFSDLIQSGFLGLYKAIPLYDESKGYMFSTYAIWWIHNEIHRFLQDKGRIIKCPTRILDLLSKINKAKLKLIQKYSNQNISAEIISEELDISVDKINEAFLFEKYMTFGSGCPTTIKNTDDYYELDDSEISDSNSIDIDQLIDDNNKENKVYKTLEIIKSNDKTRGEVLERVFALGGRDEEETLQKIGEDYGVSRECVRLWKVRAQKNFEMVYSRL